jgi:hypothetical protein
MSGRMSTATGQPTARALADVLLHLQRVRPNAIRPCPQRYVVSRIAPSGPERCPFEVLSDAVGCPSSARATLTRRPASCLRATAERSPATRSAYVTVAARRREIGYVRRRALATLRPARRTRTEEHGGTSRVQRAASSARRRVNTPATRTQRVLRTNCDTPARCSDPMSQATMGRPAPLLALWTRSAGPVATAAPLPTRRSLPLM